MITLRYSESGDCFKVSENGHASVLTVLRASVDVVGYGVTDILNILNDVLQDLGCDLHARDMNHIHAAWRMGDLRDDARHLAEIRA